MIESALLVLLATYTAKDSFNTEYELFHRERLCDIVISTNLETFKNIFLQSLCGKEDDWNFRVGLADLLSKGESILLRHHYVEDANVELALEESLIASLTIRAKLCLIALCL